MAPVHQGQPALPPQAAQAGHAMHHAIAQVWLRLNGESPIKTENVEIKS